MRNGIWKKIGSTAIALSLFTTFLSDSKAQDKFREFDRKMVATPAELFEALSAFQPAERRREVDEARLKEIENAGREFFSKLSPEQQDKAWEFAEKYLRKNGVDSASSQKLMKDFGLPPEMQSELSKQFRKFGKRSSGQGSEAEGKPDDEISDLLRRAKDQFKATTRKTGSPGDDVGSSRLDSPASDASSDAESKSERNSPADADLSKPNRTGKLRESSQRKPQEDSSDANRRDQKTDSESGMRSNSDEPIGRSKDVTNSTDLESENPFDSLKPRTSSSANRSATENGANENGRLGANPEKAEGKPAGNVTGNSDDDLERLLERFGDLRKDAKNGKRAGSGVGEESLAEDLDWESVIKKLAEDQADKRAAASGSDTARERAADSEMKPGTEAMQRALERAKAESDRSEGATTGPVDRNLMKRAKELFSGALNPDKKPESDTRGWNTWTGPTRKEGLDSQFNRLVVKAAERTLRGDDDEQGVPQSVSSAFGSLIERIQEKATGKKDDREEAAERRGAQRDINRNRNDDSASREQDVSSGMREGGVMDAKPDSQEVMEPNPTMPSSSDSGLDPQKILDGIPDFSSINPTQVFTFFAIAGLLMFVGYFLLQSFVDNETTVGKRNVIKQIKRAKIESPKDLIATVDVFLLAKFGVKASWWNAKIAQTVLASGSPELRRQVDDLMSDYVRARYMRQEAKTSVEDRQRYKKTLEELSSLEFKPTRDLRTTKPSVVHGSPAPVEG